MHCRSKCVIASDDEKVLFVSNEVIGGLENE